MKRHGGYPSNRPAHRPVCARKRRNHAKQISSGRNAAAPSGLASVPVSCSRNSSYNQRSNIADTAEMGRGDGRYPSNHPVPRTP